MNRRNMTALLKKDGKHYEGAKRYNNIRDKRPKRHHGFRSLETVGPGDCPLPTHGVAVVRRGSQPDENFSSLFGGFTTKTLRKQR